MSLTRREREVLALVARGMTDAAIARTLSISPRTVAHHCAAIYRKLGVPNRTAATRVYWSAGSSDGTTGGRGIGQLYAVPSAEAKKLATASPIAATGGT